MAPTTAKKTASPKAKATKGAGVVKKAPVATKAGKKNNARNAMVLMQAYFKEHRDQFRDLSFKDQQKELGKMWKVAPENPKVAAAAV